MPKRITLDRAYIARVKKENAHMEAKVAPMERKKIPCKYCNCRTIDKYEDLTGHFTTRGYVKHENFWTALQKSSVRDTSKQWRIRKTTARLQRKKAAVIK